MEIIREAKVWQKIRFNSDHSSKTVGFVPTMGALHSGHASLISKAHAENDLVVCSVFVNPTQFNDPQDLAKYPRTIEDDAQLAEKAGCNYLYVPDVNEIYGHILEVEPINFGLLTHTLEGHFRPGHFDGVAAVVKKLLLAVQPNRAYFGKKDFQQLSIVREMVKKEALDVQVVGCDLIRDENGLALSSRNARLSPEEKVNALIISRVLYEMAQKSPQLKPVEVENWAREELRSSPHIELEYLEIVNGSDFRKYAHWEDYEEAMALCAAFVGGIRLLDNLQIFPQV